MPSSSPNDPSSDMRDRIVKEAIQLFGQRGYKGTSLQAIADAVGVKRPSLMHHFECKEDILEEAINQILLQWAVDLPKFLYNITSGYKMFSSTIKKTVELFLDDKNRAQLVLRELLDRPEKSRVVLKDNIGPWLKLIVNYINMGQEAGVIRKDVNPYYYLILNWLMIVGTVAVGRVFAEDGSAEDETPHPMIEELVRIARTSLFLDRGKGDRKKKAKKRSG